VAIEGNDFEELMKQLEERVEELRVAPEKQKELLMETNALQSKAVPQITREKEQPKNALKEVQVRHDQIANWMIANPQASRAQIAEHFQVSVAWISILVHSDAFRLHLKEKQDAVFMATVVPLRQKTEAAAHIGIEKVAEALVHSSAISDKGFIVETTEKLLQHLEPKGQMPGVNVQQNFYSAPAEAVRNAREVLLSVGNKPKELKQIESQSEETQYPAAERV